MVIVAKNGIKQHFKPIFGKESDLRTKQQFRSYAHLIAIDKRPATLQINQLALGLCPLVANRAGSHAQKRELAPLQEPVGELRADCYGVRLYLFTVQVTVVQVRPHLEALEHLAIPYRALHLAFVHHIVKLHIQVIAADILCPANGSQTQQAYKKHLLHNIMDLLVWKSVFSRANRNGLKR